MITYQSAARLHNREIVLFRLQNARGAYVELLNYGATLVSFVLLNRKRKPENFILRYDKIEDYFSDPFYLGATIGRFANRISKAQFSIHGETYFLDKNDGNNSNHGGFSGFNSRIFDYEIKDNRVIFSYESPDGEGGFPGNLRFSVAYSFSDNNELLIEYTAVSDKETIFNPTNHAYFNLSAGRESILCHELEVYAENYLEANDEFIPTGKLCSLSGPSARAFDFRESEKLFHLMPLKRDTIPGYNVYFTLPANNELKRMASLREPRSGRVLDVYSTMPGIQVYTGDYLSEPFCIFAGIALEAQGYPDAPNHAHFPSCLLSPGKEVKHTVKYCISDKNISAGSGWQKSK